MLVLVTDLPLLDSRKIISVTQSHIVKDVAMDVGSGRWGGGDGSGPFTVMLQLCGP
jgi:hypothetical protein